MKKNKASILFHILLIFSLMCCKHSPFIKATPGLLRPWHKDANNLEPYDYPFIATYQKGKKQLIFVAGEHVTGLDNKTVDTIRFAFAKKPQVVVIEGFAYEHGVCPKSFLARAKECAQTDFNGCIEPYFSMYMADKNSLPFYGGEPSDLEILKFITQHGYTAQDFIGFKLLSAVPQWQREGKLAGVSFESEAREMLRETSKRLGVNPSMTLELFYKWYKERSGSKTLKSGVIIEDTGPHGGSYATYFQKLSHHISIYRDRFVVEHVVSLLNRYDRVLVTYGGSHHFVQQPAYDELLGAPQFLKPF